MNKKYFKKIAESINQPKSSGSLPSYEEQDLAPTCFRTFSTSLSLFLQILYNSID